jgi:hypothetical protein
MAGNLLEGSWYLLEWEMQFVAGWWFWARANLQWVRWVSIVETLSFSSHHLDIELEHFISIHALLIRVWTLKGIASDKRHGDWRIGKLPRQPFAFPYALLYPRVDVDSPEPHLPQTIFFENPSLDNVTASRWSFSPACPESDAIFWRVPQTNQPLLAR